jgi:hypothetical protein
MSPRPAGTFPIVTRLLSVITPVHGDSVNYLFAAYESLERQQLPVGWAWEWLVQEDGQLGVVDAHLASDSRISSGSGRAGGPAVARMLALARAEGEVIKVLDADDQLTDGALARDLEALARPEIEWTSSRALDLLADGSTVRVDDEPDEGPLERGSVLAYWRTHDHRLPVHPATLCIRTDLLLALGGWMALPASEDTGLLLAADAVSTGYFTATTSLLYRKWVGQSTHQAPHAEPAERAARQRIVARRAESLRARVSNPGAVS